MKTWRFESLFLAALLVQPLLGNGGGYFRGGVEHSGDIAGFEPESTEKIRILDEKLTVLLGAEEAAVEIRYLMRNETDRKVRVRFGFPVEESFDNDFMGYNGDGDKKKAPDGRELAYCRNYRLTAAGKPVKAKWQGELNPAGDARFKGVAGWLVSEMVFSANEEKPVMIRFQSGYPMEEWSVSDNGSRTAAMFRYRLSTAACWAGTIGTGRIVLRPDGIQPDWLRVIKPVNRFEKDGADWVWNFENLEPGMADDLVIEARPAQKTYYAGSDTDDGGSLYIERNERWTMAHSNYQVTASSTLPPEGGHRYDVGNIREFWSETMWSEGAAGTGVGEWLEIVPKVPKPLEAIVMRPGCAKSDALFEANARPKKIRVELNGEHRFSVNVPDSKDEFEFAVTGYARPVKKIRLTLEEVYPGKRYEDLCISGVQLHVRLDKKPKIQQAR